MSTKLKAKHPKSAEPSKPKLLLYGKPGVGKTWGALDFPAAYFIDCENGARLSHYTDKLEKAGGVYMGQESGANSFPEVIEQFKALATEKHEYKTVIVDSISKLFNSAITEEAERLATKGTKDEFGLSRKPAVAYIKRLLHWANRLDMNVIFIAHEKSEWGLDANKTRTEIGSTFDAYDKMEYELDLCFAIRKQGDSRTAKIRKSRLLGFPEAETFDWNYPTFAERYGKDIIEAASVPIELASKESVNECKRLVDVVRVSEDDLGKWFSKAGVESFEEMDAATIAKITDFLHAKVAKAA